MFDLGSKPIRNSFKFMLQIRSHLLIPKSKQFGYKGSWYVGRRIGGIREKKGFYVATWQFVCAWRRFGLSDVCNELNRFNSRPGLTGNQLVEWTILAKYQNAVSDNVRPTALLRIKNDYDLALWLWCDFQTRSHWRHQRRQIVKCRKTAVNLRSLRQRSLTAVSEVVTRVTRAASCKTFVYSKLIVDIFNCSAYALLRNSDH